LHILSRASHKCPTKIWYVDELVDLNENVEWPNATLQALKLII